MSDIKNNPVGTRGFAFLEFGARDFKLLKQQFSQLGFGYLGQKRDENVYLFAQGDVRFIINGSEGSHAAQFASKHGNSVSAMGFLVDDASQAFHVAVSRGAVAVSSVTNTLPFPAIYGIGESIIYFVESSALAAYFETVSDGMQHEGDLVGLLTIDHLTHNVSRGQMDRWSDFYKIIFNFKELRSFDIEGKLTGLHSRAMCSPCGKIKIPISESSDDHSQIEEFIKEFNGEGIQHIAFAANDIYQAVETLRSADIKFLDTPDTYYEGISQRIPWQQENLERLKKNRILIDGEQSESSGILLQIFTENMLGPVFFEIIQRKGNDGFGEGNFQALFESIELDQIRRGVLKDNS